jgi:hypothetical protein
LKLMVVARFEVLLIMLVLLKVLLLKQHVLILQHNNPLRDWVGQVAILPR